MDPLSEPGWDDLVASHPDGSFAHTAAWARVLVSSYGYRPFYFTEVKDCRMSGLIPVMEIRSWLTGCRGVSLPFTDECEVILPEGTTFDDAVQRVKDFGKSRRWETLELRDRVPGMEGIPPSMEYYVHEMDLSRPEDGIFSGLRANVQRNIRRAEKEGVTVESEASSANLREFYRLNCLTRREHGLPPQPIRFFENLREHVLSKGKGTLLLARYRGNCVAGAVFVHHGCQAIFKYGASDRRFQRLRANNLVLWEAIRSYNGRGFRIFSFGRTNIGHAGLRHFKQSWGSSERLLRYYECNLDSGAWGGKKRFRNLPGEKVLSRLPLAVLKAAGTLAYRHIG